MSLRVEERGAAAGWGVCHPGQELMRRRRIAEGEGGLHRRHESLLSGLLSVAERLGDLNRGYAVLQRVLEPSLGAGDGCPCGQVARLVLNVARALEVREERKDPACLLRPAAVEVNLHERAEEAEHDRAGARVLLTRFRDECERLVPAAEHEERVCQLR